MVIAGNETTPKLLGNAWYWGATYPEQIAEHSTDVRGFAKLPVTVQVR